MVILSTTLYRPVGENELQLIRESGNKHFPPRLPEQPIFYPVCNIEYARLIARGWNARNGKTGYVTEFNIDGDFVKRYSRQIVGSKIHEELWVPAEELDIFNDHIIDLIHAIEKYTS